MKIAIFPGSFDPFHEGHKNILIKAQSLFDKIFVVVTNNVEKKHKLGLNDRKSNVQLLINDLENIEVVVNENHLSVDFAKSLGAKWMIRSIRNVNDYIYEKNIFTNNKISDANIETIYFFPDKKLESISSSKINESDK